MRILPPLALGAVLLAACGGSSPGSIPRPAADRLAAESAQVAALVRAGDGCRAAAVARRLARDAAPFPEVQASAAALAAEITCVPPAPAAAQPSVSVPDEREDNDHGKHGRGHEKRGEGD